MSAGISEEFIDALEQAARSALIAGFRTFREAYLGGRTTTQATVRETEMPTSPSGTDLWPEDAAEDFRPGTTGRWLLERLRPYPTEFDFADLDAIVADYERWRPYTNSARYTINNALGFLRDRGYIEFDSRKRGRYRKRRPA